MNAPKPPETETPTRHILEATNLGSLQPQAAEFTLPHLRPTIKTLRGRKWGVDDDMGDGGSSEIWSRLSS
ncbi:hypothetical protein NLI96_g8176 [Meripilus lineatus]|uniref:Uncharacterized protein n=1 Tax=Meripilus lineatus TaxID=2056292 RepID=A0AAD5YE76_9APHY|nr:hypothetical protein NLI96_g8176 [Physisporinus lineatus]